MVSKEFTESGRFSCIGTIDYPLPNNCGNVEAGDVIKNEEWWRRPMQATVLKTYINKNGVVNAVVFVRSDGMETWDKLATWQGLNFTVGILKNHEDLLTLEDTVTGEKFKPNVVVLTKNLNRGLVARLGR